MILVTGATGIVGAQILTQLVAQNKQVIAIKRATSDTSWTASINNKIKWVEADLLDLLALEEAFKQASYVVHCAAVISFDNSQDKHMEQVNVEGTKNVLALAQKFQVKKFIHISSVAALGRVANQTEVTEESKWTDSLLNTAYGTSKYKAELQVWRAQAEGLPTVILNPSVILGPGKWSSSSTQLFKYVKNKSPFYPTGSINYVDVRDVASIAILFLGHSIQGERYILNAGMSPYQQFFSKMAATIQVKPPFLKLNPKLAIFVASLLQVFRKITGIKTTITRESVLLSQLNILFSSKKITHLLDYSFIPLENSLRWTYEEINKKM